MLGFMCDSGGYRVPKEGQNRMFMGTTDHVVSRRGMFTICRITEHLHASSF